MHWMLKHSRKMDRQLKKALIGSYRFSRKVPCLLQEWVNPLYERMRKHAVILQFSEPLTDDATADSIIERYNIYGLSVNYVHSNINCVAAKVSIHGLKMLCEHDKIEHIYLDREVHTLLDVSTPAVGAAAAQASGFTGKGVTIAVIDTGIYPHPDLTTPVNRIVGFKDFINNRTAPYDDNGHGTHVAGDAAGNGTESNGVYKGSAPEANLVGVKVLNKTGSGQLSTVIAGIDWCVQNKDRYGIRIISMSLGSSASSSWKNDPVCQAVEHAVSSGLVVVVAAGNEGPSTGTIASPGTSPSVITVGAVDTHRTVMQTDDKVTDFSSRGPTIDGLVKPDIVSPGAAITALRSPGSYLDKTNPGARNGSWYFTLSGTSMATPIVSGTVAQVLQQNPQLTPEQVKTLLKNNAFSLGDAPNNQGSGEVNVTFLTKGSGGVQPPGSTDPTQTAGGKIEWAFTKADQHPEAVLTKLLESAKSSIDMAIYSITYPDIVQAVMNAHKRGVKVRLITDRTEASNSAQSNALSALSAAGVPVKENSHPGLMHLKISIIDGSIITTGSFNYSKAASTTNDDVLVIVRDSVMAALWGRQYERMWSDSANFVDYK